jgi:hypothetical protein
MAEDCSAEVSKSETTAGFWSVYFNPMGWGTRRRVGCGRGEGGILARIGDRHGRPILTGIPTVDLRGAVATWAAMIGMDNYGLSAWLRSISSSVGSALRVCGTPREVSPKTAEG